MSSEKVMRVLGALFVFGGIASIGAGVWFTNDQIRVLKTWPETQAVITRSDVDSYVEVDLSRTETRQTTMYRAKTEFRYRVNGREYTTSVTANYSSGDYDKVRRDADAFRPGSTRAIRYDPANPADIRHDAGYTAGFFLGSVLFGGVGLLFTVLGLVFIVVFGRNRAAA